MAAGAQEGNSNQSGQPSPPGASATPSGAGETATNPNTITPGLEVAAPRPEQELPPLKPDQFEDCTKTFTTPSSEGGLDIIAMASCEHQLVGERRVVIEACVNPHGDTAPPRVIQACTELLDRNVFERYERYAVLVNRAHAYFAQHDRQRALDDYTEAVKLSPHNANIYYDRGLFYAAQSDNDAALRDYNTALSMNAKLVPALRQRANLYQSQGNFDNALADFSEAIRLQPKTAVLWSERGYVYLRHHDNQGAIKDEAHAIQLDPKLAVAYFFRGAAFAGLGDSGNAVNDLKASVDIDPTLARYVSTKGKTASLTLPPPP